MRVTEPYFMTNPEWYYHDEEDFCYKLTDKAPKEAISSYIDFYRDTIVRGDDFLVKLGYISQKEFEKEYEQAMRINHMN